MLRVDLSTGRAGLDPAELLLRSGLLPMFDSNPRCSASGSLEDCEFGLEFLLLAGPLLLWPFSLACVAKRRLWWRGCCFKGSATCRGARLHVRDLTCTPAMLQCEAGRVWLSMLVAVGDLLGW